MDLLEVELQSTQLQEVYKTSSQMYQDNQNMRTHFFFPWLTIIGHTYAHKPYV